MTHTASVVPFKLEFPDGRWTIDEKSLEEPPHIGDVVEFDRPWRVQAIELLRSRVGSDRSLFVCRPA